ncbi:PilW family protein [Variovorax sp. PAMC26660]|uniref:PilW family protein n=1 Tax=Variovorax sp. PAMC26660 TaxID=2762322 RepID=UPI00164CFD29|nr:PilW family protein [Variovorax sp. PAMC26660]QNK70158.1 PilW family protein [Variovorax sp. PAMC26660]
MQASMRNRRLIQRAHQLGFSIIELMVAIAIALFIIGAVASIYLNMRNTFTSQDSLAQLQDSERLALTMLTTTIQSAGYFVDPTKTTALTSLPAVTVTRADKSTSVFSAGQAVVGSGDGTGNGSNSDTLAVQYQTAQNDGLMNCQGATNTTTPLLVSVNSFAINSTNELTCTVGSGSPEVLASNVYQMSVLYGVDTDLDGSMDTYMTASAVTTANGWANVYTAQVTLTFLDVIKSKLGAPVQMPTSVVQTINLMNRQ